MADLQLQPTRNFGGTGGLVVSNKPQPLDPGKERGYLLQANKRLDGSQDQSRRA